MAAPRRAPTMPDGSTPTPSGRQVVPQDPNGWQQPGAGGQPQYGSTPGTPAPAQPSDPGRLPAIEPKRQPQQQYSLDDAMMWQQLTMAITGQADPSLPSLEQLGAQIQRRDQINQLDAQVGHDLAWTDPYFQNTPTLMGPSQGSQVYADPRAVAQQQSVFDQMQGLAGQQMQFEGSGRQQSIFDQIGSLQAPNWAGSDARQQDAYGRISNSYNPQYMSDAQQQSALRQIQSNNSNQQQDAMNRIYQNNDFEQRVSLNDIRNNNSGQQEVWLNRIGQNNSGGQRDALDRIYSNTDREQSNALSAIYSNNSNKQREVANDMQALYESGGAQGITWDDGQRQADQYGNLNEIIDGRGASEIEMARRQSQRADQEQWLRSQREATMREYEQRGLSGSGAELLSVGQAQQGAAGRNSLADLETAAHLEDRRMGAIAMAGDLAGVMRGQTQQEQMFQAGRSDNALFARGDMENSIRGMDLQRDVSAGALATDMRSLDQQRDIAGGNLQTDIRGLDLQRDVAGAGVATDIRGLDLQRDVSAGALATDMRGLDLQRDIAGGSMANSIRSMDLNRDIAAGDMTNALRNAAYLEQTALGQATQNALNSAGMLSTNIRDSSFAEGMARATSADQISMINNQAINASSMANSSFLQDAYLSTQAQRAANQRAEWGYQVGAAESVMGHDQRDVLAAFDQATSLGIANTEAINRSIADRRNAALGAQGLGAQTDLSVTLAGNNNLDDIGSNIGQAVDQSKASQPIRQPPNQPQAGQSTTNSTPGGSFINEIGQAQRR